MQNRVQRHRLFRAPAVGTCAGGAIPIGRGFHRVPAWQNFENFVQSVDYNISSRDQLRGRYIYNKVDKVDQAQTCQRSTPCSPSVFISLPSANTTPSLLRSSTSFGWASTATSTPLPAGDFQFPGLDAFPNLILLDLGGNGLQLGPDSQAPQFTIQNLYQGVDNVSWTRGIHTLKFGGEFRWYISPQSFTQRQRGDYDYNSSQLFLEDFSPDNFGERSAGSVTYYGNQKAVYWYANDNWKVNPHLALNLGIRYEYTTISTSEAQQA